MTRQQKEQFVLEDADLDDHATRVAELARCQREAIETLIVRPDRSADHPLSVADVIADTLRWTLVFIVALDGSRAPWAFALLRSIEDEVLEAANLAAATRQ
jgi:hypothetical protein